MKKSQVLAALALAFALGLGVVVPAANTYARVVVYDDNGVPVTDTETEAKVQAAITAAKGSCGWHLVSGDNAYDDKTYFYDQYLALDQMLEYARGEVEKTEKSIYGDLKANYATAIGDLKTALEGAGVRLPAGVKTAFDTDVKTYDQAVTFINRMLGYLRNASTEYRKNDDTDIYDAYTEAINYLSNAEYDDGGTPAKGQLMIADEAVKSTKDTQAYNVETTVIAITGDDRDDDVEYADIVATAKGLKSTENGVCTLQKAVDLKKAVDYAQSLIDNETDNFSVADADKAIAAINKVMNGGTITPDDLPEDPKDDEKDKELGNFTTPDTGVLAGSENGAASTVATVAGIATALTAAGAGVVAYRNARRSTRK